MIIEAFPEDPQTAIAVAMAESHLNPYATNATDNHGTCLGSYGIFQIGCVHGSELNNLYNVEYNIKKARQLYDERGWQPWGAHTNGSYLAYMQ